MILAIQLALTIVTTPYAAKVFPLKPATIEGKVQCFSPNIARRTCQSMARYRGNGSYYVNEATILIESMERTTMRISNPVRVVNDAVCAVLQPADVAGAVIVRDGVVVSRDLAKPILALVATEMASVMRRETCTRFSAAPTGFVAKVSINGVYQPALDRPGIWVSPAEGFTVAR